MVLNLPNFRLEVLNPQFRICGFLLGLHSILWVLSLHQYIQVLNKVLLQVLCTPLSLTGHGMEMAGCLPVWSTLKTM